MNNDAIEMLRIQTQMNRQWETLTKSILMLWIMIILLGTVSVVTGYRLAGLQAEVEQLKSRQTQRLIQSEQAAQRPNLESRSAGAGHDAEKTAGN